MSTFPPESPKGTSSGLRSRLADPRLVSWYSFAISTVLLSYEILLRGFVSFALSQLLVFTLLAIARFLYLGRSYPRSHAWVMTTTIIFSSFLGVIFAQIPLASSDTVVAADGAFSRIVVIPVAGLLSISLFDYRNNMRALRTISEQLLITRDEGLAALASARKDMATRVESSLETTLEALTADDSAIDDTHLSDLAQDTVRPLSHELATNLPDFTPRPATPSRVPWSAVLTEVAARPLIVPWLMALGVTILSIRFTFAQVSTPVGLSKVTFGPVTLSVNVESLVSSLTFLGVVFISVWLLSCLVARVTAPLLPRLTGGNRWLVIAASVLVIGVGLQIVLLLTPLLLRTLEGTETNPWARFWAFAPVVVIALVLAISRTVSFARLALVRDQESVNADLAWEVARIRLDLWSQQRRFAQAVHGPLQAAITASALLIAQAPGGSREQGSLTPEQATQRAQLVRDAHDRILHAFHAVIDHEESSTAFIPALDEVVRTWRGVCEVSLDAPDDVQDVLAQDDTCRRAVVMVVGEAVANAAIHGGATVAQVEVQLHGRRFISVSVVNDGSPVRDRATAGLGSALLDEVCSQWNVISSGPSTRLTALLALSRTADRSAIHATKGTVTPTPANDATWKVSAQP